MIIVEKADCKRQGQVRYTGVGFDCRFWCDKPGCQEVANGYLPTDASLSFEKAAEYLSTDKRQVSADDVAKDPARATRMLLGKGMDILGAECPDSKTNRRP